MDTSSFVASTLNISNEDLKKGKFAFEQAKDKAMAEIVNNGLITVSKNGTVAFVGGSVTNNGKIKVENGNVFLLAGQKITLSDLSNPAITYSLSAPKNKVLNLGDVFAKNGKITLSGGKVTNKGTLNVHSTDKDKQGHVTISAKEGDVSLGGKISADGVYRGGAIKITGKGITVEENAVIDLKGKQGGGTAYIGGDEQGKGTIQLAEKTEIKKGAKIDASATEKGNGGKVVIWGDKAKVDGKITAKGGEKAGDGGFVETSGNILKLSKNLHIDTSAPKGKLGDWLLDPVNVFVRDCSLTSYCNSDDVNMTFIDKSMFENGLKYTNAFITASTGITFEDTINVSESETETTFQLKAPYISLSRPIIAPKVTLDIQTAELNSIFGFHVNNFYLNKHTTEEKGIAYFGSSGDYGYKVENLFKISSFDDVHFHSNYGLETKIASIDSYKLSLGGITSEQLSIKSHKIGFQSIHTKDLEILPLEIKDQATINHEEPSINIGSLYTSGNSTLHTKGNIFINHDILLSGDSPLNIIGNVNFRENEYAKNINGNDNFISIKGNVEGYGNIKTLGGLLIQGNVNNNGNIEGEHISIEGDIDGNNNIRGWDDLLIKGDIKGSGRIKGYNINIIGDISGNKSISADGKMNIKVNASDYELSNKKLEAGRTLEISNSHGNIINVSNNDIKAVEGIKISAKGKIENGAGNILEEKGNNKFKTAGAYDVCISDSAGELCRKVHLENIDKPVEERPKNEETSIDDQTDNVDKPVEEKPKNEEAPINDQTENVDKLAEGQLDNEEKISFDDKDIELYKEYLDGKRVSHEILKHFKEHDYFTPENVYSDARLKRVNELTSKEDLEKALLEARTVDKIYQNQMDTLEFASYMIMSSDIGIEIVDSISARVLGIKNLSDFVKVAYDLINEKPNKKTVITASSESLMALQSRYEEKLEEIFSKKPPMFNKVYQGFKKLKRLNDSLEYIKKMVVIYNNFLTIKKIEQNRKGVNKVIKDLSVKIVDLEKKGK
ncbi:hypothetical protein [Actinobacillus indolicus]|uniref:hypothetical protein n=1 Tax=Actinobacillus indolicus TaxID=51049 RepID=UPI0031342889